MVEIWLATQICHCFRLINKSLQSVGYEPEEARLVLVF